MNDDIPGGEPPRWAEQAKKAVWGSAAVLLVAAIIAVGMGWRI